MLPFLLHIEITNAAGRRKKLFKIHRRQKKQINSAKCIFNLHKEPTEI